MTMAVIRRAGRILKQGRRLRFSNATKLSRGMMKINSATGSLTASAIGSSAEKLSPGTGTATASAAPAGKQAEVVTSKYADQTAAVSAHIEKLAVLFSLVPPTIELPRNQNLKPESGNQIWKPETGNQKPFSMQSPRPYSLPESLKDLAGRAQRVL